MSKFVTPSVTETAFNCPHCGALAQQFWYTLYAQKNTEESPKPYVVTSEMPEEFYLGISDTTTREFLRDLHRKLASGAIRIAENSKSFYCYEIDNLNISKCYNCNCASLWLHDKLVYPKPTSGPLPHPDLPEAIKKDALEASVILADSPRGAAALLRLCIQKLCQHLGKSGDLNDMIGSLVKDGLDQKVQKALDGVRVVGNQAVHPGVMDLTDDRATAETLFKLLDLIVERLISEPRHIEDMYAKLPEGARKAIERRDKKD